MSRLSPRSLTTAAALLPSMAAFTVGLSLIVGVSGLAGAATPVIAAKKPPKSIRCTMTECYSAAMRRSPLIAAARTDVDKYAALLREANSTRYPKFEMTAFTTVLPTLKDGRTGSDMFDDWDWSRPGPFMTGQLSISQALWTFGKIDTLRHMAKTGIAVGAAVQQVAAMEMHFQLARAWWTLVLADELDGIITEGEKHLNRERKRLEDAEEDDDFDPNSVLQLRMLEADFEDRVRTARRTRALAEDGLRMALDEPPTTQIKARADGLKPLAFPMLPSSGYEMIAVANHPRLVAQRGGLAVKLDQIRYEQNRMWPDILLVGRAAYTYAPTHNTTTSVTENPTNPTVSGGGIALRWNIDLFRQIVRVDKAEIEHLRAKSALRGEEQKILLEVRRLVRECVDAKAMMRIHDRAMRAARGWLRTEEEAMGGGFSEYRELARALEQFYRRKLTYLETIHRYNVLVAELSRAVGTDITKVRVKPPVQTAKPGAKPATKSSTASQ